MYQWHLQYQKGKLNQNQFKKGGKSLTHRQRINLDKLHHSHSYE